MSTNFTHKHRPNLFDATRPQRFLFATTPLPGHVNPDRGKRDALRPG